MLRSYANTSNKKSSHLDLDLTLGTLLLLSVVGLSLGTHDTTTPVTLGLLVLLHVASLDGLDELGELVLVLLADLGESESSGGLAETLVLALKTEDRDELPSCGRQFRDGPCP